ncbi:MAG: DNA repair protein RecN [Oscillospiraceae bacterium]|nr:DNA repair protein RecN [Oscillospiraceae bacterium]
MLKSLNIENIAVIDKSETQLMSGFNVLTGETGAGKSIIIDSINAVLGERTSKELIRNGCNKAMVSAAFSDLNEKALTAIYDQGFEPDDDGFLVVQRTLNLDGKNICRINGVQASLATLKEIGKCLINIHGQHDNQALLNPDSHIDFLDSFASIDELIKDYQVSYNALKSVKKEFVKINTDEGYKAQRVDLLQYQISEITAANVKDGEAEDLVKKRDYILNSEKIVTALNGAYTMLSGTDDTAGAVSMVETATENLESISSILNDVNLSVDILASCGYNLSEISEDLRNIIDSFEFNPLELQEIQDRLDLLYKLKHKYGDTESEILEYLSKAQVELESIELNDKRQEELLKEQELYEEEVYNKGLILTDARQKAAVSFCESVCSILKYLEMPNVTFVVDNKPGIYTRRGCDKVEFLISANAGEPPKPLSKIASGGELSRIMLAIKSVLTDVDDIQTLIFDEIDVGISGRTAGKVGNQLKILSKSHQVICVTHLAQIAAIANNHMLIEKQVHDQKTYTSVSNICGDDRIREIARIMSGGEMTESLYNSAKELIESGETV